MYERACNLKYNFLKLNASHIAHSTFVIKTSKVIVKWKYINVHFHYYISVLDDTQRYKKLMKNGHTDKQAKAQKFSKLKFIQRWFFKLSTCSHYKNHSSIYFIFLPISAIIGKWYGKQFQYSLRRQVDFLVIKLDRYDTFILNIKKNQTLYSSYFNF